jgi:pyruvate/2-oxoglutarate dehydrogenase complex dihydrolipoamide acyltransferase (E2) component
MGLEEGTIVRWLKAQGDRVVAGEPLVEVETAKTTQEIETPATGILASILVQEGEDVPVNTALAIIEPE